VVKKALKALSSLELAVSCLTCLMLLVAACTLAQVNLGTHGAVEAYMRPFFVRFRGVPVFPGGALVGAVLLVNLIAAQSLRFERSWRKAGLWLTHAGLVLLFCGEFISGGFQVETQMPIEEGSTRSWTEHTRRFELALVDATDPRKDKVYAVPQELLERGGSIAGPLPFPLRAAGWHANASLEQVAGKLVSFEQPPASADDAFDHPSVEVEALGQTWLLSSELAARQFTHEGRLYKLALRAERHYLPFSLTLKDFKHDKYPGTDIPRNFSSLVRLRHPERGEDRDVLIYMNHPLRYEGKTFFQSSFGKDDTLSVLLVVRNPAWRLPYLACLLVAAGLAWHFLVKLRKA
jgi:hypothetical protein